MDLNRQAKGNRQKAIGFSLMVFSFCLLALVIEPLVSIVRPFASTLEPSALSLQPVEKIEVSGLHSISEDELLYLLGIKKGKVIDETDIREGIKRAFLKGIFEDIILESLDDNRTKIKITVREKNIIDSIKIVGNNHFSSRFIKKQLGIEDGERFNLLNLKEAVESLKNSLKKRGFVNSKITTEIVHKKDNKIIIIVNIIEGEPEVIKKIIISEPEDIVKSYLRLSEGDILDHTEIERLTKKVKQYYKEQGYIGTSLTYSYSNGILDIRLDTGKKLIISFNGNTAMQSKILLKEMPFFEANIFSDDIVEETTARIISLYHQQGYPFAQVAPVISLSDGTISLEFFIFEGQKHIVDSIKFEGIEGKLTLPQESLKNILTLQIGGYYNPDALGSDAETLIEFYHALGYLYVEVQEPDIKIEDNKVEIKFYIKEGPQVRLSGISIKNNKSIKEEDILREVQLKVSEPYNEVDISNARRKILEIYNKQGFLDTTVTVEREISGSDANIIFTVNEGKVTFFGKAVVIGNKQTRYPVINRELMHTEGSPLNYNLVLQERHKLYRLGLFTDVETKLSDMLGDKRDVLYRLKEADAGAIEFGFGYGEYEKLRGFFDINYKNLWGMNKQASFRIEMSTLERRFMLSYYEPWFMEKKDLSFKALLVHEDRKEKGLDTKDIRYRIKRDTASAGIEKKLSETLKTEIYYDFSVVKTRDIKPDIVLSKEDTGTLVISAIRPGLIYDTRDNPFEPKKGLLAGLSFKVASGMLFSETDFTKMLLYINKYQSLSKRIVLALSIRGGIAKGFGTTRDLPIVERFFLGGRTTVRGYEQDTLGPKGADGTPIGGNAFAMGNVEFRTDVGKGFGIVAFLDGGNVWKKAEDIDVSTLKYTTGLGLRYNTPVGPFRLDYGHKLNREKGESKGEIHFSIGHAF
ncbi:outer membrane protein assembly factor [hot springs metagenome]|uniref:Outer membrane protein assembly factor n=1 Tax=hot springs metagenome TaxID=433727 RepID=A0A5J4L5W8_9ZZZZ